MRKRFKSFHAAARSLLELDPHGSIKTVSFDVFDTLVHRRIDPNLLLRGVARALGDQLRRRGLEPASDLLDARHAAYMELTEVKAAAGLDREITLDELCPAWVRHAAGRAFSGDEEMGRRMASIEGEYERWSCYANPTMNKASRILKERGFRLLFISDMYLGRRYVEPILEESGYSGVFDAGYVSGDHSLLKRTGRLFDEVLAREGLEPGELLHVGDDPLGDGKQPAKKGIGTFVIRDKVAARRFRRLRYDHHRLIHAPQWSGVAAAAYSQSAPGVLATPEEAYGQRILGPIFAAFIHRVLERCREENIGRVYFIAREGFLLRQLYETIAETALDGEPAPPATYLCVSRMTAFMAAMHGYSLREIAAARANVDLITVRNLLAPLTLDDEMLTEIVSGSGIHDADAELPSFYRTWPPFQRVLEHPTLRKHVEHEGREARRLLIRYLEQLGFFDQQRVALVDVGWSGQIQDNLYAALRERGQRPRIFGFYLGLRARAHWRKTPDSWMECTLSDETDLDWAGLAAFEFVQAFEMVTRAPHGTVLGYRERAQDGGSKTVAPVFRDEDSPARQAEMTNDPAIALFQSGITAYTRRYAQAVRILGARAEAMLPYARSMVERMIRFPTPWEASWLLQTRNVSDLGVSTIVDMGRLTRPQRLPFRVRVLKEILRDSFWKYGTLGLFNARALQVVWAVRAARKTLPRRRKKGHSGVAYPTPQQGNPWHDDPVRPGRDLPQVAEQPFEQSIRETHAALLEHSRRMRSLRRISALTAPLTLREAAWSWLTFQIVSRVYRITRNIRLHHGGISFRGMIARHLAAYPVFFRVQRIMERLTRPRNAV